MRRKLVRDKVTYIIGITGGIGSGKSTLAQCFKAHGVPVLNADAISRSALLPGAACFADVVSLLGDDIVLPDGSVDRALIASRVFSDPALLEGLNGIVHPYVREELLKNSERTDSPLIVWDVPLLFESGLDAFCACTVSVLCDEEIRVARAVLRDGTDGEKVRARIRAQITDVEREQRSTYTIRNEGTVEAFIKEADALIERIREELQ